MAPGSRLVGGSKAVGRFLGRPALALTTAFVANMAPPTYPGWGTKSSLLGSPRPGSWGILPERRRGCAAMQSSIRPMDDPLSTARARGEMGKSITLLEQRLAELGLTTALIPPTDADPICAAIAMQLQQMGVFSDDADALVLAQKVHKEVSDYIQAKSNLGGANGGEGANMLMSAAAEVYGVTVLHLVGTLNGISETMHRPGDDSASINRKVTVCSAGPLLWSTRPRPGGSAVGDLSKELGGLGAKGGPSEASSIASAVRLSSEASLTASLPPPGASMINDLLSDNVDNGGLGEDQLDKGGAAADPNVQRMQDSDDGLDLSGNHYILVDSSSHIYRAYHGIPHMNRTDGTPTNAVYGYTRMIRQLVSENPGANIVCCFDHRGRNQTFRREMYPEYKAQRDATPENLKPQFALIREATLAFNVQLVDAPAFEADDIIATYAAEAERGGARVTIVSGDKDLYQLLSPSVTMLDSIKNRRLGPAEVEEKMGVPPSQMADLLALMGDSSDNIPGCPGVGPKKAAALLLSYGSLDEVLSRAHTIPYPKLREAIESNKEQVELSRALVNLRFDAPVPPLRTLTFRPPDTTALNEFYAAQRFVFRENPGDFVFAGGGGNSKSSGRSSNSGSASVGGGEGNFEPPGAWNPEPSQQARPAAKQGDASPPSPLAKQALGDRDDAMPHTPQAFSGSPTPSVTKTSSSSSIPLPDPPAPSAPRTTRTVSASDRHEVEITPVDTSAEEVGEMPKKGASKVIGGATGGGVGGAVSSQQQEVAGREKVSLASSKESVHGGNDEASGGGVGGGEGGDKPGQVGNGGKVATGIKAGDHYLLVDASSLIYRAYYASPKNMYRSDSVATGAVYGYCRSLRKLIAEHPDAKIICCFDNKEPTFRSKLYPNYKATRAQPPDDLIPQFDIIREATRAFNVEMVEAPSYEADDIIATYTRAAVAGGAKVTIISGDKDLYQIISDSVSMIEPIKGKRLGPAEVEEKMGVPPSQMADLLALMGDSSDNIPGCPGIGPKKAAKLLGQFGTVQALLDNVSEVKAKGERESLEANKDQVVMSRKLVELVYEAPVANLDSLEFGPVNASRINEFYKEQEFKMRETDKTKRTDRLESPQASPPTHEGESAKHELANGEEWVCRMVTTPGGLQEVLSKATADGLLAISALADSEDGHSANLVGISLALVSGESFYIPLAHQQPPPADAQAGAKGESEPEEKGVKWPSWEGPGGVSGALEMLRVVLEDPSILKVGHNIKFITTILTWNMEAGGPLKLERFDDVMLIAYTLFAGKGSKYELGDMVAEHFGGSMISLREIAQAAGLKRGKPQLEKLDPNLVLKWGAEHSAYAVCLHRYLRPRLVKNGVVTPYETMERPLVQVLAKMEAYGVKVDVDALQSMSDDLGMQLEELERCVYGLAGREFNIGSPKQLGEVLFEEMKIPGGKKGKSGTWTTDSETIEEMSKAGFEIAKHIDSWRTQSKLKSSFTDSLMKKINPRTGRIHTKFAMAATATGRLSSLDPNLQNIPAVGMGKKVRATFIAEEGYTLLSADYSQIELRLLASLANIDALQQAFMDGTDVHSLTASQVFNVPLDQMTSDIRRNAKAINFGIIYGQSKFGLAKGLGVSNDEAESYIASYFKQYPGIAAYMTRTKESASRTGYVETLFGRRCHLANIQGSGALRSYAERQAINAPIQGTAADIIKRAMVRMQGELDRAGVKSKMLLQVHDELLFEVPDGEMEATKEVVKRVMEGAAEPAQSLAVPLIVDMGDGTNWGDAH